MPFITQKGCCGSSLQRTCLVIGIVFLVLNLLTAVCGCYFFSFLTYGLPPVLYVITSICLILAAKLENKYLCIPWIIGFVIAIASCIIALVDVITYLNSETRRSKENYRYRENSDNAAAIVFSVLAYCTLRFLVELVLLRYVISYYEELGN